MFLSKLLKKKKTEDEDALLKIEVQLVTGYLGTT